MAKRQKHVFRDTREIAHLWMHQTQDNARNPHGNFYFNGATIYSYGSHFPIARHVTNAAGKPAILFTTRGWSNTTARHISDVRMALDPAVPVFYVTNPGRLTDSEVMTDYRSQIEWVIGGVKERAQKKTKLAALGRIAGLVESANQYAEWAGSAERLAVPATFEQVVGDLAAAKLEAERLAEAARIKAAAKAKREAVKYRKEHAGDVDEWRRTGHEYRASDGKYIDLRYWTEGGALLRLNGQGQVETSMGSRVPVDHAKRAYRFVAAIRARGEEWISNGHTFHIGHYRLDYVTPGGDIRAGCHKISWAEIERLATEAGWTGGGDDGNDEGPGGGEGPSPESSGDGQRPGFFTRGVSGQEVSQIAG